jgi:hypothetical protein
VALAGFESRLKQFLIVTPHDMVPAAGNRLACRHNHNAICLIKQTSIVRAFLVSLCTAFKTEALFLGDTVSELTVLLY